MARAVYLKLRLQEKLSGRMGLEVKMSATQLADRLEELYTGIHITEAAKMLRQQADEIKNLQEQFDKAIEFLAKANNMTRKQ